MNTSAPNPLASLHPVMAQALAPFLLLPSDHKLAADFAGPSFPIDPDAVAFHVANDARALRLQILDQRPLMASGLWA